MVDYSRQEALSLHVPGSVTIVGVGGVGSWVAILSAMSGVKNIFLFDPDTVEPSNLNRLPFCEGSIGKKKVDVVVDHVLAIRPECNIVGIAEKLEDMFVPVVLQYTNVLIECTDSPVSQLKLYNACKDSFTKFIRAGYDGTRMTVTSTVSGWIRQDEEVDYTIQPSWVVPAVTVAAIAVGKMMKWFEQETSVNMSDIGVDVLQKRSRLTQRCVQISGRRG